MIQIPQNSSYINNTEDEKYNPKLVNAPNDIYINKNSEIKNLKDKLFFYITFLGRIIITIYSFYGAFFIINFIFQYILLIPGFIYEVENTTYHILLFIIYFFFSIYTSNILIIPIYEFLTFPFLRYNNPMAHFHSFFIFIDLITEKNDIRKISDKNLNINESFLFINIFLIIVEISYIIGYIIYISSNKIIFIDYIEILILFSVNLYHFIIFFSYAIISIYLIYKLLNFSYLKYIGNKYFIIKKIFDFNSFFENKEKIPEINLLSYAINPLLDKCHYENNTNIDNIYDIKYIKEINLKEKLIIYIKFIIYYLNFILYISFSVFSLFLTYIIFSKKNFISIIFFIILYVLIFILSFVINFPIIFTNRNIFNYLFITKIKLKKEYEIKCIKLITIIRFFINSIIILITISCLLGFFFIKRAFRKRSNFPYEFPLSQKDISNNLILPNICSTTLYGIPIYLYIPFINDAYYYDSYPNRKKNFSSFDVESYKNIFFDENYDIQVIGNLIDYKKFPEKSVKMIQYNVKIKNMGLTIISIKGSSSKKDIFIDLQLYFPSVIYNVISLSFFHRNTKSLLYKFIEYSLFVPYRLLSQYAILKEYLDDLQNAFIKNQNSFYENIVFVGHSLGGSFSKILGILTNIPVVSLSGPGVNSFLFIMGHKDNYYAPIIDLVPYLDIFSRFFNIKSSKYKIFCKTGPFECHSNIISLCETLIMCKNPNYEEYCKKLAGFNDDKIEDFLKSYEKN